MGPIIGRALAAGAAALAKRAAKKGAEEGAKKQGPSISSIASGNSKRKGTDMADEMIEAETKVAAKKDLATAQANPARQAAEKAATTAEEGGVKVTRYPYVKPTPENMRRGGVVKSSVTRGDGCAQRGKTKGRMI
jgi:hypothetical protein